MWIDILIAVDPQEVRSAILTLESVVLDCDIDCRLAVLMHGGPRKDFAELDELLSTNEMVELDDKGEEVKRIKSFTWTVAHERRPLNFNTKLAKVGKLKKNALAALVFAGFEMNDPKWFGKVQQTFLKDPRNMVTVVLPFVNGSLHPNRLPHNVDATGRMILGGLDFADILTFCVGGQENLSLDFRKGVRRLGGNRWSIESVRYEFMACPESLEPKAIPFG